MNTQTQTTQPYQRKVGFFGSVKRLGVTGVTGTINITEDVIGVTTDITGTARNITSVGKEAIAIWSDSILDGIIVDGAISAVENEAEFKSTLASSNLTESEQSKVMKKLAEARARRAR